MNDLAGHLALEQDERDARQHAASLGATLQADTTDAGTYWLTMIPPAAPEERFHARIAWTSYPGAPPSVKFADAVGGRLDLSSSWPIIPGYRPGERDICQPFTAEGHAVHPAWSNGPEAWQPTGNPFLAVVSQLLHGMIDKYQGRSA